MKINRKFLEKTTIGVLISLIAFSPTFSFFAEGQTSTECIQWLLVEKTSGAGMTSTATFKNPINEGDAGFSKSKPSIPSEFDAEDVEWKCTNKRGTSATSKAGESEMQGMELCNKAAEISTKWGGFTSLDYVQKDLMDSAKTYLSREIGGALGFPDFRLDVKEYIDKFKNEAGKFFQGNFDKLVKNPLKEGVKKQTDDIKKAVQEELTKIGAEFAKDVAGDAIGDAAKGLLGASAIPVQDESLKEKAEEQIENQKKIIVEQKKAILVQDTRDECSRVYNATIDTIKRSVLYQFSTQITDWIVNDEKPQFIKNPGKFLEDTARLAVDRTISRIAPNLCEPFRLNVQIQIPTVAREANPFYEQVTCTLDQVTSNIENFYNDFKDGGWVAYQEMWKPQNNYFGAMMMIESELAAQQQAALQAAQDDLNRGQGFTSEKKCTQWMLYKKVDCPKPADGPVTASMRRSMGIDYMPDDDCYTTSVFTGDAPEDGSAPDLPSDAPSGSYYDCMGGEITTPGTLTSDLSKRAQQTDFDYISQMQSGDIENFLETIENAIINKLVKSGVKGLQGLLKGLPEIKIKL